MLEGTQTNLKMEPYQLISIKLAKHRQWVSTMTQGDKTEGERLFWSNLTNPERDYFLQAIDLSSQIIPYVVYRGADFEDKEMPRVRFAKCLMFRANLKRAFFPFAIFEGCNMEELEMTFSPELFTVLFKNNEKTDTVKFFNQAGVKLKGIGINPQTGRLEKTEISLEDKASLAEGCSCLCDFEEVFKEAWKRYPKEMAFLGYPKPLTPPVRQPALQVG